MKKEDAKVKDDIYFGKYIYSNIMYSIRYNDNETISKDNLFDWFVENIGVNTKLISEISISFSAQEEDKRESLYLTFNCDKIYYDTTTTNVGEHTLANLIENYINKLPPRLDDLINKDQRRKMIPSLVFSIPFGICVSFLLLILGKLNIIPIEISKFLSNGFSLTAICFVIAFLGFLLIPNQNTSLYKNIKIGTYYAGYDRDSLKSIYKNDYAEYKSKCEVAIGENVNLPQVREKIKLNYSKSKKIIYIELIILVIAIILFFVL